MPGLNPRNISTSAKCYRDMNVHHPVSYSLGFVIATTNVCIIYKRIYTYIQGLYLRLSRLCVAAPSGVEQINISFASLSVTECDFIHRSEVSSFFSSSYFLFFFFFRHFSSKLHSGATVSFYNRMNSLLLLRMEQMRNEAFELLRKHRRVHTFLCITARRLTVIQKFNRSGNYALRLLL